MGKGSGAGALVAVMAACAPHPAVLVEEPAGGGGSSSSSSGGAGGGAPEDFCRAWSADLSADNLRSVNRFAFHRSTAVVEGTLGAPVLLREQWYAPLHVETVHIGWKFLEGTDTLVAVEAATVGPQPSLVGLPTNRPTTLEFASAPVWGNVMAVVPASERDTYAEALAYPGEALIHVAVVRIAEQDAHRTRFEVMEVLKGTFPPSFSDNWYGEWRLPYPPVDAGRRYIAGVQGLATIPGGTWLGTVIDFRPATDDALAAVRHALASPAVPYDRAALRAARDLAMTGYLFHTAPVVVSSVVTGMAEECCSNLGGTYVAHNVSSVLQGSASATSFIAGGHGYQGGESCGDVFVSGLSGVVDPATGHGGAFACTPGGGVMPWDAAALSPVVVRLPSSPESLSQVHGWLTASDPVNAVREAADAQPTPQRADNAPWSLPLDAVAGLAGARAVLFTVDEVTDHPDFHEVLISTILSLYEYPHLPRHQLRLAFSCGDERLLRQGSRWIGGLVTTGQVSFDPAHPGDLGAAYLVPGVLIPPAAMSAALAQELATFNP